jgi:hypothetical protein
MRFQLIQGHVIAAGEGRAPFFNGAGLCRRNRLVFHGDQTA